MATDSAVVKKAYAESVAVGAYSFQETVTKTYAEVITSQALAGVAPVVNQVIAIKSFAEHVSTTTFTYSASVGKAYAEVIMSVAASPPPAATYPQESNPTTPNPFLASPPVVQVIRHVRITGSGEVVAEDPQTLYRYFARSVQPRTYPQRLNEPSYARQFPNVMMGNRKKTY